MKKLEWRRQLYASREKDPTEVLANIAQDSEINAAEHKDRRMYSIGHSSHSMEELLEILKVQKLPSCRVKKVLLNSCRPLAAEVMTCD